MESRWSALSLHIFGAVAVGLLNHLISHISQGHPVELTPAPALIGTCPRLILQITSIATGNAVESTECLLADLELTVLRVVLGQTEPGLHDPLPCLHLLHFLLLHGFNPEHAEQSLVVRACHHLQVFKLVDSALGQASLCLLQFLKELLDLLDVVASASLLGHRQEVLETAPLFSHVRLVGHDGHIFVEILNVVHPEVIVIVKVVQVV